MKRNMLAICDPEQEYAYRLMDALSRREDFPFEMLAFTGTDRLKESLAERPVRILLIARSAFDAEMKGWGASRIILLNEEEGPEEEELPSLSKYSSVTRIMKKSWRRPRRPETCRRRSPANIPSISWASIRRSTGVCKPHFLSSWARFWPALTGFYI